MNIEDFKRNPLLLGRNEAYGLRGMHELGFDGKGIKVGLIDDFDKNHGNNTDSNIDEPYVNNQIFGTAPGCKVIHYDMPINHTLIDVAKAIKQCIVDQVDVISLSISGTGNFSTLREVVEEAYKANILIVCSAGNTGKEWQDDVSIIRYPAAYDETVSVGCVDNQFSWSEFESHSKNIDLVGFGENVVVKNMDGIYTLATGTSFSTPTIAGLFACVWSKFRQQGQEPTVDDLKKYVYDRCVDLGQLGHDMYYGNGFPTMNINDFMQTRRALGLVRTTIKMQIGNNVYEVNGETKIMDTAPVIDENNRTLTPARAVAEALGASVKWDNETRTVIIEL